MIAKGSQVHIKEELIDGSESAIGFIKEMRAHPIVTIERGKTSEQGFNYYQVCENGYTYTEDFFKKEFTATPSSVSMDIFMGETNVTKLVEELKELKEALTSSKSKVENVEATPCHAIAREELLKESTTSAFGLTQDGVRSFATGAVRDTSKGKPPMEYLPWDLMDRVAFHFGNGGDKYGYNNYRLGQPKKDVYASLMRHARKYFMGDTSEDHLSAIIWNAFSLMHTDVYYPDDKDLNNLQDYKEKIRGKHE